MKYALKPLAVSLILIVAALPVTVQAQKTLPKRGPDGKFIIGTIATPDPNRAARERSHNELWDSLRTAIDNGDLSKVKQIVTAHPDLVNYETVASTCALDFAVGGRHLEIAHFLLDHGAKVYSFDLESRLSACMVNADLPMAQLLISRGAKVKHSNGYPPLYRGEKKGSVAVTKLLLSKGADVNEVAAFASRRTALAGAVEADNLEEVKLLVSAGAQFDETNEKVRTYLQANNIVANNMPKLVLSTPKPVDSGEETMTLYYRALTNGDISSVRSIIGRSRGYENSIFPKHGGTSPLMLAVIGSPKYNPSLWKMLLPRSNVNQQTFIGDTALHFAVEYGRIDAVTELLAKGAKANIANNQGQTALHKCVLVAPINRNILRLLLKHGANPKAEDKSGYSAIDYAVKIGDRVIESDLRGH